MSLSRLQSENMFNMVNAFLYQYRCQMELREIRYFSEIYERDAENHKKRKLVKSRNSVEKYLIITGNGCEHICVVTEDNGKYQFFVHGERPWVRGSKCSYEEYDIDSAKKRIEAICYQHYLNKYGENEAPYSSFGKTRKRLSVGEICDWYNRFSKLDVSIKEVEELIAWRKELRRSKISDEDMRVLVKGIKVFEKACRTL